MIGAAHDDQGADERTPGGSETFGPGIRTEARIRVIDMHTGGEPVRIVRGGCPPVPGATILDKRRHAREHLDHLRRFLMFEPRGHVDMYGAWLVEPSLPGADLAVLFLHNQGYSTMCGHATIALGRFAVDHGLVAATEPETTVGLECPCGLVRVHVAVEGGRAGRVHFDSVPSFLYRRQAAFRVAGAGMVTADVAYGGAFYAIAPAAAFGLDVRASRTRDLVDAATALSAAVRQDGPIVHPDHEDLGFLYGSILTDGGDEMSSDPTANICVFADAEVDRSPTGSGVSARLAAQHARGLIEPGQIRIFESVTGSQFAGQVSALTVCGPHPAIIATVGGKAHYSGEATFVLEPDDDIGRGFLLR